MPRAPGGLGFLDPGPQGVAADAVPSHRQENRGCPQLGPRPPSCAGRAGNGRGGCLNTEFTPPRSFAAGTPSRCLAFLPQEEPTEPNSRFLPGGAGTMSSPPAPGCPTPWRHRHSAAAVDLRDPTEVGEASSPSSTCRAGRGGGPGVSAGPEDCSGIRSFSEVPDSHNTAFPVLIHMCFNEVKLTKLIVVK